MMAPTPARDVFSRVLYGGRVSLGIGTLAVVIAISMGSLVGAVAGYRGGWVDAVSMRTVDLLLSFPRLVLLITIVALVEPAAIVTVPESAVKSLPDVAEPPTV